ncbi:MAG: hypothetical protein JSV31_30990 [Desulfobacterales bacterium]|nr:MAG: hypothetical protein JSV31_30990 [Desulfobacterales bacterium]
MNTFKLLVITLIFAQLSGCATNAPQIPDYFASQSVGLNAVMQKVALVKVLAPPEIESVDLGYTRGQGAAAGAAFGALSGYYAWASGGTCEGYVCGAVVLLLPVFVSIGALIGGIEGSETGYSSDTLKEAEANARAMLQTPYLQTQLINHARNYATDNTDIQFIRMPEADPEIISEKPNYAALSAEGVNNVLELELTHLSFDWSVLSHTPSLKMGARARMISVDTGAVLSDGRYEFISESRQLKEWAENGATKLTEAIERGIKTLAEDIVDENFLLFYPILPVREDLNQTTTSSGQNQKSQSEPVPHYVLKPVYPALEYCFFCESLFSNRPHRAIGNLEFVEVNSTQPVLRWERFPRAHDLINADGQHHQISNVRYDIKIFETGLPYKMKLVLVPTQPVYTERNILEPYHMIKETLYPCTDYFWSVRARFKLFGRKRVTEWAGAFNVAGWNEKPWNLRRGLNQYKNLPLLPTVQIDGPEWFYYPFRTPCEQ